VSRRFNVLISISGIITEIIILEDEDIDMKIWKYISTRYNAEFNIIV